MGDFGSDLNSAFGGNSDDKFGQDSWGVPPVTGPANGYIGPVGGTGGLGVLLKASAEGRLRATKNLVWGGKNTRLLTVGSLKVSETGKLSKAKSSGWWTK
jgi:hypothetical protein